MNVKIFRDIDELKIWGNKHGFRLLRDPDDKTKYKVCLTDADVDKLETFVRSQQAEIEALKAKLNKYHLKEDLDRNLNLIYGKEFIK